MASGRPANHQGGRGEGDQAPGRTVDSSGPLGSSSPVGQGSGGPAGAGRGGRRFIFDIASDFAQARDAQDQIMGEVVSREFGDNDIFALRLALEEAVINAIKHGNKLDPAKRVKIDATVSDDEVVVTIHDQGPGFRREAVPDPTLEENLEKNCGRGILLIEAYMTTAEWTDQGRRLHMSKRREASLVPKAS